MKTKIVGSLLAASLMAALSSCGEADEGPQPLDSLNYPTDMVVGGAGGDVLYVVSTNFDRRYAGGALHAIDMTELDAIADGVTSPTPAGFAQAPWLGGVNIGSFGGRIAVVPREGGGERLFVPLRGDGAIVVVDADGAGGLACYGEGGTDCRRDLVKLATPTGDPIADPFAVASVGEHVYVAALRVQRTETDGEAPVSTAWLARVPVDEPEAVVVRSVGRLITRDLVPGLDGLHLFAVGARPDPLTGEVRSFLVDAFEEEQIPAQAHSLGQAVGSSDGRALVFSEDGSRAYTLTRSPSALVELSVGAQGGAGSLTTLSTIPLPESPSRLLLIEEDGGRLAAVTSTAADALVLVDLELGEVVAVLDGTVCEDLEQPCPQGGRVVERRDPSTDVGVQPWAMVRGTPADGGARVWVASFPEGALRAVDIPDLRRAGEARVRAILSLGEEEGR